MIEETSPVPDERVRRGLPGVGADGPAVRQVFNRIHGLLPEPEYGLLVASEFEEEKSHPHFGLSVEWSRDMEQRGCARFLPEIVDWSQMRQAAGCPANPEEQWRLFHEI